MTNSIQSIALDRLAAHPDNPNEMSRVNFAKLVRNIERSGRYEPLIVRLHPKKDGCFEIINGHHRCQALAKLGYKEADCIIWDVDDEQTDILLATLNRLGGSDELGKKLALLNRLNKRLEPAKLAKLLPQTAKQIERLTNLKMPAQPAKTTAKLFANPMVFFLTDTQHQTVEDALSLAKEGKDEKTKLVKNSAALAQIASHFLNNSTTNSGSFQ